MDKIDKQYFDLIFENSNKYENVEQLYRIVGADVMSEILFHYGGDSIYIPLFSEFEKIQRNKAIQEEYKEQGLSCKEIAKKHKMTSRNVRYVLFGNESLKEDNL